MNRVVHVPAATLRQVLALLNEASLKNRQFGNLEAEQMASTARSMLEQLLDAEPEMGEPTRRDPT